MWWSRKDPKPINLGSYLDTVTDLCNNRLASGPSQKWLDAYNRKALEKTLGITKIGPLVLPVSTLFPPTPLIFTPEMPSVFFDDEPGKPYRGNDLAKQRIDYRIQALGINDRLKFLLVGPAGIGKTALAWVIAYRVLARREMLGIHDGRFFEILPGQFENKAELDIFMRQLRPYDIVFIDEIHTLKEAVGAEPLYHTLADSGTPRYPLSAGEGWIEIPPGVCWIGATTEPGKLDGTTGGALRRRLAPEIRLEDPTLEDLTEIVLDLHPQVPEESAIAIASRSGGLPWQAILLHDEAKAIALAEFGGDITDEAVEKAFVVVGVDDNGLLPTDRTIIATLLRVEHVMADGTVLHRMSEPALRAASGIDEATFKDQVQPKLLRMGLLSVRGGQVLTPKAETLYGHLA